MMQENLEHNAACARAEDLVTYLYGEASAQEAAEFKRHMQQCDSCSSELAAFGLVREDVIEWRNQSLPSFDSSKAIAPVIPGGAAPNRKRSALAALREFFTLAPAWMRAATTVAALAVCALVVFTALHFSEPERVVQVVTAPPTQAQADQMSKQRADELRQKETQEAQAPLAPEKQSVVAAKPSGAAGRVKAGRDARVSIAKRNQNPMTPYKIKASQAAREQLAELVQVSREDDGLPRLSDLIDDSNESQ